MSKVPEKILVFNVNWVGDVIFTTPIFKALKKMYPQSRICCLAMPRVMGILECVPGLDETIVYDEKGRHHSLLGKLRLLKELKRRKFDIVFLLHRSWTRALLVFLAGIPERVGYATKKRGQLLTRKIPEGDLHAHRSERYLRVLESYGIPVEDRTCELKVDTRSEQEIVSLLEIHGVRKNDFTIVLHVSGNWDLKRWPKQNFTALISLLTRQTRAKVIIPGTVKDKQLITDIVRGCDPSPLVLAGKTNLKQLIALMARADLVISADSGPMHIANCVGTNVIALFGPTRPEITGPRGRGQAVILQKNLTCNQEPCYQLNCPENRCMQAVSVDEVMAAVKKFVPSGWQQI